MTSLFDASFLELARFLVIRIPFELSTILKNEVWKTFEAENGRWMGILLLCLQQNKENPC